MALKKDKKQIIGEFFDDERIAGFLIGPAPLGVNRDFHLLERAYRGMQLENFVTFLGMFTRTGHDLDSANPEGFTLLQLVEKHEAFSEFADALREAGAQG